MANKNNFFLRKVFLIVFCVFVIGCQNKKLDFLDIDGSGIIVHGDYVKYVNVGDVYIEDGASYNDKVVDDITYHNHGRQVAKIDTRFPNNYLVTYKVKVSGKVIKANRIVIIDNIK
ncbi:MAG: hypothetical protein IKF82_07555 [Bacilli bacterium]|nr:hypothetical protein [Bacilli bacterium]